MPPKRFTVGRSVVVATFLATLLLAAASVGAGPVGRPAEPAAAPARVPAAGPGDPQPGSPAPPAAAGAHLEPVLQEHGLLRQARRSRPGAPAVASATVGPPTAESPPPEPSGIPPRAAAPSPAPAPLSPAPAPPAPGREDPAPSLPRDRLLVLGYYTEDWDGDTRSLESLRRAGTRVDLVASFQFRVTAGGELAGRAYPRLTDRARRSRTPVLALFHNYAGSGFDRGIARSILATAEARERSARAVAWTVREGGFAGVNIDLENIPPSLRGAFTDYVRRIAAHLRPDGYLVTISAPAKLGDERQNGWTGAFDYRALAPLVDLFVVMAYDQHLPGGPAGPIAAPDWVEAVIRYARSQIPAEKILLGVPQYAYDWIEGTTQGRGLSVPGAHGLAEKSGAPVLWDEGAGSGLFRYTDPEGRRRVVYVEDRRGLEQKLVLARKYGLRGVAIWRLGLEDPGIWPLIDGYRR
ncbi:glycosyl hydrolase family 18 protein [Caldinitratiruptor microaerophilus]|uniref:GH18 domain-containing protein n=1 Tax=Caldinitratiruptor microaerophilus TaxID=671077 RepID=A0AA35G825_9FIRM|nr:glycosyl hydrolase family 18 protein [Caldinitratiruptor microaerophilus]BDG59973.1 hypothetical protein caldi_10630 [Caldinitratiruptor microaerophilus]